MKHIPDRLPSRTSEIPEKKSDLIETKAQLIILLEKENIL